MTDRAVRRTVALATAGGIVMLGALAGSLASADTPPTLTAPTLSANPVVPGQTITVNGTGCTPDVAGPSGSVTSTVTSTTTSTITESVIPTTTDITTDVPTTLATTQTVTSTNTDTTPPVTSTATITSPVATTTVPVTLTGVPTTITTPVSPPITATNTVTATTTTTATPATPTVTVTLVNGAAVIASPDPVTANPDGTWTVTLTVPATTGPGSYTVASSCGFTNYPGPVILTVVAALLPAVQVSPSTVAVGGSFDIIGQNFVAGEQVTAELHSDTVQLGSATASSTGGVSLVATIPTGTPLGQHEVQLLGARGDSATALLTVVAAPTASSKGTGLAATGANSDMTIEGSLMFVVGLAILALTFQWTINTERVVATRRKQQTYRPVRAIQWEPAPATVAQPTESNPPELLRRQRRRH